MDEGVDSKSLAAIVLAGGFSTRFGQGNKLLSKMDGEPVLARTIAPLLQLDLADRVVVLGHDHEAVCRALPGDGIRTVVAPDFSAGLGHTIRAGIGALPKRISGVFIVLGDMPWVSIDVYQALISAMNGEEPADAFVPVHNGRWGNPVLFRASTFAELLKLTGDQGAKGLLRDGTLSVAEVPCLSAGIFMDIDHLNDLERDG